MEKNTSDLRTHFSDVRKTSKPFKPKSKVWPYFEDASASDGGVRMSCLVCKEKKNREHLMKAPGGSTSSMIFHLKQHKEEFEKFQEDSKLEKQDKKDKNAKRKHDELSLGIVSSS